MHGSGVSVFELESPAECQSGKVGTTNPAPGDLNCEYGFCNVAQQHTVGRLTSEDMRGRAGFCRAVG